LTTLDLFLCSSVGSASSLLLSCGRVASVQPQCSETIHVHITSVHSACVTHTPTGTHTKPRPYKWQAARTAAWRPHSGARNSTR
jgi:hypothetical protein